MSDIVTTAPAAVSIKPLDPERDAAAAAILAPATGAGTVERGREVIAEARSDPDAAIYSLTVDGELAAVYVLRKVSLMNEIASLAVAEGHDAVVMVVDQQEWPAQLRTEQRDIQS